MLLEKFQVFQIQKLKKKIDSESVDPQDSFKNGISVEFEFSYNGILSFIDKSNNSTGNVVSS